MAGVAILRGLVGGLSGAAGNTETQDQMAAANKQAEQQRQAEQRAKIAPLAVNIKSLQAKLADAPEGTPEHQALVDQIQGNVHSMREVLHPDWKPGPAEWFKTHVTDRAHITNAARRQDNRDVDRLQTFNTEQNIGSAAASAVTPNVLNPEERHAAERIKAGLDQKDTTEQERFTKEYKLNHPGASTEEALRHFTDATTKEPTKPLKGLKAIDTGGLFLGVENQDTGEKYLPSQLAENGNAPPEAKEIWKQVKQAKAEKEALEEGKENQRLMMQARAIAAGFERMGASQQFQELMAQFRSDQAVFKTLKTQAEQSNETVQALRMQYAQPGNKAVADNELQNFYTSVVQKGGRKTAAELALTLKIGSFGMNIEQMAKKAYSGELPDALRESLLDGMEAVAKEQESFAEKARPELPAITAPSGPGKQKLKSMQGGSGGQQHKVGEIKKFPNGATGVWDGHGWVAQAGK